jgi:hypothetical protein
MKNINKLVLIIFLAFISLTAVAQQKTDSTHTSVPDVIIKTNGDLFQCRIVEVNDSLVRYQLPIQGTTGLVKNVIRGEVYAIAYGNGIAMIITPKLMGKEAQRSTINALAQQKADSILRTT